jgi:hypothetical protein
LRSPISLLQHPPSSRQHRSHPVAPLRAETAGDFEPGRGEALVRDAPESLSPLICDFVSPVRVAKHILIESNGLLLAGLELVAGEGLHTSESATNRAGFRDGELAGNFPPHSYPIVRIKGGKMRLKTNDLRSRNTCY